MLVRTELSHLYAKRIENSATFILQPDKPYSTIVCLMIYGVAQYNPFLVQYALFFFADVIMSEKRYRRERHDLRSKSEMDTITALTEKILTGNL